MSFASDIETLSLQGDKTTRQTVFGLQCQLPALSHDFFLCLASSKRTTALWALPTDGAEPRGLVTLPGPNFQPSPAAGGRILLDGAGITFLFDFETGELLQVKLDGDEEPAEDAEQGWVSNLELFDYDYFQKMALAPRHLALVETDWQASPRTTLRVFEIPE